MKIEIIEIDQEFPQIWFNNYIGQTFEVTGIVNGIPMQYVVNVSRLVNQGLLSQSSRGIAYVPFAFARELVKDDLSKKVEGSRQQE